jgi:hypothetical protein
MVFLKESSIKKSNEKQIEQNIAQNNKQKVNQEKHDLGFTCHKHFDPL